MVAALATLGLVRVRRMLGVYDVGRIVNPKLADSRMVGGIGQALLEHTVTDHRDGRIVIYTACAGRIVRSGGGACAGGVAEGAAEDVDEGAGG